MIATLVTILLLAFSLAACHKTSGDDNNNPDTPPTPPTPPAPTEFTVTFDSCGGNTVPSVKGKTVQTEPLPERDGFDFVGCTKIPITAAIASCSLTPFRKT